MEPAREEEEITEGLVRRQPLSALPAGGYALCIKSAFGRKWPVATIPATCRWTMILRHHPAQPSSGKPRVGRTLLSAAFDADLVYWQLPTGNSFRALPTTDHQTNHR